MEKKLSLSMMMAKIDYLQNEKTFQSEIKNIFPCFTGALF